MKEWGTLKRLKLSISKFAILIVYAFPFMNAKTFKKGKNHIKKEHCISISKLTN